MSKQLYQSASNWLNNPADYSVGLNLFCQLSRNTNLINSLTKRPRLSALEYELKKLIPKSEPTPFIDSELELSKSSSNEEIDRVLFDAHSKLEWLDSLWKPVFKDYANDLSELQKLYALKLAGGNTKSIKKQAQELAGTVLDKMDYCTHIWGVKKYVEESKVWPSNVVIKEYGAQVFEEDKPDTYLTELFAKSDADLVKALMNCRSNVSRVSTKADRLPVWKNRVAEIEKELKRRGHGNT